MLERCLGNKFVFALASMYVGPVPRLRLLYPADPGLLPHRAERQLLQQRANINVSPAHKKNIWSYSK